MDFFLQFIPALVLLGGITIALYFGLRRSPRWRWLIAIPPALFGLLFVAVLVTG